MALFVVQNLIISVPALVLSSVITEAFLSRLIIYILFYLIGIHTSVLLPGIVSQLNPLGVLSGSLFSGALLWIFAFYHRRNSSDLSIPEPQLESSLDTSQAQPNTLFLGWNKYQPILVFLGMLLILVLLQGQRLHLWVLLTFLVHPLSSWDVVTYHLPNAVDYLQAESLWHIQGPFSQYPGGNEVVNLWSLVPFQTDIMLGLTHTTQVLALALLLADFTTLITKSSLLRGAMLLGIYLSALAMPFWIAMMFAIARNDLLLMLITLAAVWSLHQHWLSPNSQKTFWLITFALLLGMAISVKPTGIPFAVLAIAYWIWQEKKLGHFRFRNLLTILVLMLGTGGFWYLRNLIIQGSLVTTHVSQAGLQLSILYNLLNPNFYNWNLDFRLYFASLVINLIFLCLMILKSEWRGDPLLQLLVYFALGSWLIMLITPYGASPGTLGGETLNFTIQLRYSTVLIPCTLLLLAYGVVCVSGRLFPPALPIKTLHLQQLHPWSLGLLLHGGLALIVGIQLATYAPPIGLPHYDRILFWPQPDQPISDIYRWVHTHLHGQTIYSVGLRPYGLYGFPFSNRVIEHQGEPTILAIKQGFENSQADYLAISRDPFTAEFPEGITQLVQEMKLVYHDPLAGVLTRP